LNADAGNGDFVAGAAVIDITPSESVFLYGYPNVPRWSTGVHDPLLASALFLASGNERCLFLSTDAVFVDAALTARVRRRIVHLVPPAGVMISATHTHSGPVTVDCLPCSHDKNVPKADRGYLARLEDALVNAAVQACTSAVPAEIGLSVADSTGLGTNRRDPRGIIDTQMPALMVRSALSHAPVAVLVICNMHPTVLHEDSTLISGDFPGLARRYLQRHVLGANCPVLWNTGPAGNLSPRHVVRANTFDEAHRLGKIAADAIALAIEKIASFETPSVKCYQESVELPLRRFPSPQQARETLMIAQNRLNTLRQSGASRQTVRTAECDWFGAQETLTLSEAALDGRASAAAANCMPAEIQLIRIGRWKFVGWPGEMFVEFGLQLKQASPNTFPIAYANGELQGYLVTAQAAAEGGYEASNALFRSPESGQRLVQATIELIERTK
jgi:hypothetical protein